MKTLTENDVEITVYCEPEDIPVRGNFDSGDKEADRQLENEIIERLERGDQWAWCCVRVVARWNGLEGADTLGGCSYDSEKAFREFGDYFDDMKANALEELNKQAQKIALEIGLPQGIIDMPCGNYTEGE